MYYYLFYKVISAMRENDYNVEVELGRLSSSEASTNKDSTHQFHWDYKENGPDMWANTVEKCRGKKQSPINVDQYQVEYDLNLKPFLFLNYDNSLNFNITHNGHTGRFHS